MQPLLAAKRLIFLDETGVTTNMARRYGRAPKSKRVRGYAPGGHWKITTFLAGLDRNGIVAPFVVDQPMNRAIFTQYVRQYLAPELRCGDIVTCDNLSSHKGAEAAALIAERGARLRFLPAYSPDLNPIELAFAKLKQLLRKAGERTRDGLCLAPPPLNQRIASTADNLMGLGFGSARSQELKLRVQSAQ